MQVDELVSQFIGFLVSLLAFAFVLTGGAIFRKKESEEDMEQGTLGDELKVSKSRKKEGSVKKGVIRMGTLDDPQAFKPNESSELLVAPPTASRQSCQKKNCTLTTKQIVLGAEILKKPLSLRR